MLFTTAEVLLFLTVARFLWFLGFLWLFFFFFFLLHVFLFSPWILSLSKETAGAFMLQLSAGPSGAFQMERVSVGPGFSSSVHMQTGRIRRRREEGGSLRRMLGARSEGLCIHPISVKKVETKRGQQEAVEIGHVSDILANVINSGKARNLR